MTTPDPLSSNLRKQAEETVLSYRGSKDAPGFDACVEAEISRLELQATDPLFPELIAELNAPSRDDLIQAVRDLSSGTVSNRIIAVSRHADTIKYCMEKNDV